MTKSKKVNKIVKGFVITPDLLEQIKTYSIIENRTFSNMVSTILERWLTDQKKNKPIA